MVHNRSFIIGVVFCLIQLPVFSQYRIQLKAYSLKEFTEATGVAQQARTDYGQTAYVVKTASYFKVQLGDYKTRVLAKERLVTIKRKFPKAWVVPAATPVKTYRRVSRVNDRLLARLSNSDAKPLAKQQGYKASKLDLALIDLVNLARTQPYEFLKRYRDQLVDYPLFVKKLESGITLYPLKLDEALSKTAYEFLNHKGGDFKYTHGTSITTMFVDNKACPENKDHFTDYIVDRSHEPPLCYFLPSSRLCMFTKWIKSDSQPQIPKQTSG